MPYPGSNLLSLASGGAIYIRDPHRTLVDEQLNGGAYRAAGRRRLETASRPTWKRTSGCSASASIATCSPSTASAGTPAEVYRKVMPRKDAEAEAEMEGLGE